MDLFLVSEDVISEVVMRKMVTCCMPELVFDCHNIGNQGKGYIKSRINTFNNSNDSLSMFILIDLDSDFCAPELIKEWIKRPIRKNLVLRVAVREVESWLLADVKGFAKYLNLDQSYINKEVNSPDTLSDPKQKLISLVDRCKKKEIKKDIVRIKDCSFKQGPGYNTRLSEYVHTYWDIGRACTKSDSLKRAVKAIHRFCE